MFVAMLVARVSRRPKRSARVACWLPTRVLGRLEVLVDNSLVRLVDDSGSNRALEIQETIRE